MMRMSEDRQIARQNFMPLKGRTNVGIDYEHKQLLDLINRFREEVLAVLVLATTSQTERCLQRGKFGASASRSGH